MKKSCLLLAIIFGLSACGREQKPPTVENGALAATQAQDKEEEPCLVAHSAERVFLPLTAEPPLGRILPAQENECGFYNWALQVYLHATQPTAQSQPGFVSFPSFEKAFGLPEHPNGERLTLNAGVHQAGELAGILVDQNRNPIFYSIHINQGFADFVQKYQLNDLEQLLKKPGQGGLPASLQFPPGATELKSAWKIVEPGEDTSRYFVVPARVPILKNVGDKVMPTEQYRDVTVAMLGLHVVGTVQDHPEFIWASFEHVDALNQPDLAPAAEKNPESGVTQVVNATQDYPLYAAHGSTNKFLQQPIDEASQKFAQSTPIHRVFPASLSEQSEPDEELLDMNHSLMALFKKTDPQGQDPRRFYQMIGAVWLDDPGADRSDGIFKADQIFENHGEEAVLAGEDRMSNMAMESFTQVTQPHCFSCHNTLSKRINDKVTLPPRRLNISSVLTFYVQKALPKE